MLRLHHSHIGQKAAALVVLLLVGMLPMDKAHAQWQVVDNAAITSNEKGQASQLAKMVEQYQQMVTQYTAMLTSLKSLNLNVMPVNNQLQTVDDPGALVQQACPGSSSTAGTVLNAIGMDSSMVDGEIVARQHAICVNITLLQIDKYNTVAKMLNHMNDYFSGLKQLSTTTDQLVGAVTNAVGDRQAVSNQTSQTQTSLDLEMANAQQHLQADDAAIATLQAQQSLLANIALKGSNASGPGAVAGQIIQAGAFAGAFSQH